MAAMMVFLAGCVGLGDTPSDNVETNRPRRRQTAQPATPDLRIPADAVVQAEPDIPLVPVPPPPMTRPPRTPAAPPLAATPAAAPQADGTQTTPLTARQLLDRAAACCARLDSYIVRLTRREYKNGKPGPEEIISFSFRKHPFSIHFKWLGDTAKGREVVYVKDRFEGKIHTKVAAGDALLLPAGARLSLSPDNPLVRSASRHPITDAGICHCVESLGAQLDKQEHGDRSQGTITVLAPQRRPEYPKPVEALERLIPPNVEPELPHGGRRLIYFDPEWHLPLLVITYDDKGNEVEYYRYDRLIAPANLDDDDFNPDKLWAAPPAKPTPAGDPRRR
jgi:hypothetical protein